MGFASSIAAFSTGTQRNVDRIVTGIVEIAGDRLIDYTPEGDPALWEKLPSADYHPGRAKSNWYYSLGQPDVQTNYRVDIRSVNNIDALPERAGGHVHYLSNSVEYITALEFGHSHIQAPAGILNVVVHELDGIVAEATRRAGP